MDPYQTIWFAPKQTFRNFLQRKGSQPVYYLPFLVLGASFAIEQAYVTGSIIGDNALIWTGLIMIPFGIGINYLVLGLLLPWITRSIGSIWKGQATLREMTNVYSISMIPYCILLIYQVVLVLVGTEPLLENMNDGIYYIIRVWTFALLIIGIAKVQHFSYGFALLSLLITYLPFELLTVLIRS